MNVRLFVGLLLAVGGFLVIYLAVALSFAAFYRDYPTISYARSNSCSLRGLAH